MNERLGVYRPNVSEIDARGGDTTFAQIGDFALWQTEIDRFDGVIPPDYDSRDKTGAGAAGLHEADFAQWESELKTDAPEPLPEYAKEPQTPWTESNPNGTMTEEQYRKKCEFVLGNLGHMLDVVRDKIDNEADAQRWAEYKEIIWASKSESDVYKLAELRSVLVPAVSDFALSLGMNVAEYERVSNK